MTEQKQDPLTMAPEKLVRNFTASRFFVWIATAAVLHVIVIGLMSVGYIRDRLDPEGAAQRKAAAEAAAKAEVARRAPPPPAAPAGGTGTVASAASTGATGVARSPAATNAAASDEAALLEQRKNTPMMRTLSAAAKTNEIPSQPDELGISINDTNVK